MIVIRNEQMEALELAALDGFIRKVLVFVRSECDLPQAIDHTTIPRDDGELIGLIKYFVTQAQRYGISTELGHVLFVILCLGFARDFYLIPLFRDIMQNNSRSPLTNVKIALHEASIALERIDVIHFP